jgi:uncharacterized protein YjbJ (UPF0337 family)
MNWDTLAGNWKQFKGAVQERWGDLTDDDFDRIAGQREQFIGRVQERYGETRNVAEREVDDFVATLREPSYRSSSLASTGHTRGATSCRVRSTAVTLRAHNPVPPAGPASALQARRRSPKGVT